MGKIVVTSMKNGPIRAVLEMEEERLAQFRPRERNALLARCLEKAVRVWRGIYMRVWVSKRVLEAPYNYAGDKKSPLVDTGTMAESMYTGKVVARAPGGNVKCTVTMPLSHPVTPEISRVLKVVPADQITFIAKRFTDYLARGINASEVVQTNKPDVIPQRRLTVSQRRAFGVKPRKARA